MKFCHLLLLFLLLAVAACTPSPTDVPPTATSPTPTITPTTTEAVTQTPWIITAPPQATEAQPPGQRGIFLLSLSDGGYQHLFAYSPESLPMTRLTASPWDDIAPALGPDGHWVAYTSRQNGYWDLYLLNLLDGGTLRMTDTLAYDGCPSWSPDGSWLVHETYTEQSMEIFIRSAIDLTALPIQLTNDNHLDTSPAWSPQGRQIAFVSNRSGEPEIWIASLDNASTDQFVNVSQSAGTVESHPAWSPDGTHLAWASADLTTGLTSILVWDALKPALPPVLIAAGDWPTWQDENHIATRLTSPNETALAAYNINSRLLSLPPMTIASSLEGLEYALSDVPLPGVFQATMLLTPSPLYVPELAPGEDTMPGRTTLVKIDGIQAVYSKLSDAADEAFMALRARVAVEAGWDALSSLENAFVPLSTPLDPGMETDWLYTGRAFTLNPALLQAGWMVVIREDFGQQTWWRIFLYTTAQDGSLGHPLTQVPWDFSTRTGSSQAYENGGSLMTSIPPGYWLDMSALALEYGWERLPALTNWRTYYSGAHFNELVYSQGKDWYTAMLELYPAEALITPTRVVPPTRTVTRTPLYYRSPTPTRTSTPRPTNTP